MKTKAKIMLIALLVSGGYSAQSMCSGAALRMDQAAWGAVEEGSRALVPAAVERVATQSTGPGITSRVAGALWRNPGKTPAVVLAYFWLDGLYKNRVSIAGRVNKIRGLTPMDELSTSIALINLLVCCTILLDHPLTVLLLCLKKKMRFLIM